MTVPLNPALLTPEVLAALDVVKRAFGSNIAIPAGPTVAELWAKYAAAEASQVKSWVRSAVCGREILAYFGDRNALSIAMGDIDEWRAKERQRITRRGKPPTPASRNRVLIVFRRLLNWSYDRGLIDRNPLARLKLERENNVRETVLTDADVEKIMAVAKDPLRTIVLVLFDTGMRRTEVFNLRFDQIDELNCCVRLSGAETKNGKGRRPHLTHRALAALLAIPRVTVRGSDSPSRYVFANPATGKPFNSRYIYEQYLRAVLVAGLHGIDGESITLHTLRHSFIHKARRLHLPEKTVMSQTGHLTRIAFDRYGSHCDDDELASLMSTMERGKPVVTAERQG